MSWNEKIPTFAVGKLPVSYFEPTFHSFSLLLCVPCVLLRLFSRVSLWFTSASIVELRARNRSWLTPKAAKCWLQLNASTTLFPTSPLAIWSKILRNGSTLPTPPFRSASKRSVSEQTKLRLLGEWTTARPWRPQWFERRKTGGETGGRYFDLPTVPRHPT